MIEAKALLAAVRAAGDRIGAIADGHLKDPVPSMPGYDVGSLLLHTGGFSAWVRECVATREQAQPDLDVGDDALAFHVREHAALVAELERTDPTEEAWSWGTDQRVRFWYRRAAQELTVHRWDVENAVGAISPIDADIGLDGIDEFVLEFGREADGPPQLFGGTGETLRLNASDADDYRAFRVDADRLVYVAEGVPDVTITGSAGDLVLFMWGRLPPSTFEITGDAGLAQRWHERVAI